jgi:outer membrane receptor protein involved in Fe transport
MGNNPIKVLTNNLLEQNLFSGIGSTCGSEITIKKNGEKFSGWLSYNLAWSYRKFKQINNGKPYLAQNDRRHDVSLVLMYEFTKKMNISTLFVFATGNKVNLPVSWYIIDNKVIWEFGNYNAFEMPAYHRLDLSLNYKLNSIKGIKSELNFSIYNTYNRRNPNQIWFGRTANKYDYKIKMSYLLPIIPSISWTFHF